MLEREQTKRRYVFTSEELKKKLGIEGTIKCMDLWSGRSPKDEETGVSPDTDKWYIETEDADFAP